MRPCTGRLRARCGNFNEYFLGIAAKPKDKTNGLVGKDLERDVQAELEAIKAGYQTSEQTGDHHEMMEGVS